MYIEIFGAEDCCAPYFCFGKFRGERVGEKWGVPYGIVCSFDDFSLSLTIEYFARRCRPRLPAGYST